MTATYVVIDYVMKSEECRGLASWLCEYLSEDPVICSDLSRDAFAQTEVPDVTFTPGHTHPTAAALRNAARAFADDVAAFVGVDLYNLQMSKADQRQDRTGSRQWYWAKDTNVENQDDLPLPSDMKFLCDVDYYVDMPELLVEEAKPILMYTSVPVEAAMTGQEDSSTCFSENGVFNTLVAGGGGYRHLLWNYGFDSLAARRKNFLGLTTEMVTYAVERKQVSERRQVVLLAPIKVFRGFAAVIADWIIAGHPRLDRLNPVVTVRDGSKFIRLRIQRRDGMYVSTARPDSFLSATVPAVIDDTIAGVARLSVTNIMMPTVASWVGPENKAAAVVLTEYHRLAAPSVIPTVFPVETGVRAYQYDPPNFDQEARPKLQAFMSPIVHGAHCPVFNKAGEQAAVDGRINGLKQPEPKKMKFRSRCADEFADLVLHGVVLEPVDYEFVEAKQTRPAQKLSLAKAVLSGPFLARVIRCFGKSESYSDVKDGRIISTFNDADKLDMAMFMHALSEHCKQFPWYGPGKTPLEIATRVMEICRDAMFVNLSDWKRMDGCITYTMRDCVDRRICMKAFVNHRPKMNELLKTNSDNRGVTPTGVSFDQGPAQGSGCSGTSVLQTLRSAFATYLAFRKLGMSPLDAFRALGIIFGDDGVNANLPLAALEWSAKATGLRMDASVVDRGFPGVNFLARDYSPAVWEGSLDSMCDIKRQISKFHTTVRLPDNVSPIDKLVEKSMGYLATDSNTPIIGELCRKVLSVCPFGPRRVLGVAHWWSRFEASDQYPNVNDGNWMDAELERKYPEFDREIFNIWLDSVYTPANLLEAPLCTEIKPPTPAKVAVVVDGDILPAAEEVDVDKTSKPQESAPTKKKQEKGSRTDRKVPPKVLREKKKSKGKVNPSKL